jgi:hypothetical protein
MTTNDDWRLRGQEDYLQGVTLRWKQYAGQPNWNPEWDHDHCEFCWAKFMDADLPDVLRTGYTNTEQVIHGKVRPEGGCWICPGCFEDFHERFSWKVANEMSKEF